MRIKYYRGYIVNYYNIVCSYIPKFEMQHHTIRPNMTLPTYWEIENWTTDRCLVRFYMDRNTAVLVTYSKWSKNDQPTNFDFQKPLIISVRVDHSHFPRLRGTAKKLPITISNVRCLCKHNTNTSRNFGHVPLSNDTRR